MSMEDSFTHESRGIAVPLQRILLVKSFGFRILKSIEIALYHAL